MPALLASAMGLYGLGALAVFIAYLTRTSPLSRRLFALISLFFFFVAWALQGASLSVGLSDREPLNIFSFASWCVAFFFLVFSFSTRFFKTLPLFLAAVLALLAFAQWGKGFFFFLPALDPKAHGLWWGHAHLAFIFLSFVAFILSVLVGGAALLKESELKHKRWQAVQALPPLYFLHELWSALLWIGFLFFTAGLLSGSGWSKIRHGVYLENSPKELATLGAWALYAVAVNIRGMANWRGRRAIGFSLFAFLVFLTSFLLSHTS